VSVLNSLWYIFPYFFVGHLVGDYVLQNGYIAARKSKDLRVLLLHISLVFISQLAFLIGWGFGVIQFFCVLLLAVFHFLIDFGKYKCKRSFCNTWWYYLLDQCFHILSFFVVMVPFSSINFFLNHDLVAVLSVMVFNGYFVSIFVHFITSDGIYKRDYLGYLFRMVSPVLYYVSTTVFFVYAIVMLFFVWRVVKHSKSKSIISSVVINYILTLSSSIILTGVMI